MDNNENQVPETEPEVTSAQTDPTEVPTSKIKKVHMTMPVVQGQSKDNPDPLPIPGGPMINAYRAWEMIRQMTRGEVDRNYSLEWASNLFHATWTTPTIKGQAEKTTQRPGSEWHQHLEHEGVKLKPQAPKVSVPTVDGERLVTSQALRKLNYALSPGSHIQIPLWHSGIWVKLKIPSLRERALLNQRIQLAMEEKGRNTNGLLYSSQISFVAEFVVEFFQTHAVSATVENWKEMEIENLILQPDLDTMAWGLASVLFPKGYEYAQPCLAEPDVCNHVTYDTLNVNKLLWVDKNAFTEKQRRFMANRTKVNTIAEVLDYQASIRDRVENRTARLSTETDISLSYKIPTIAQMIEAGNLWLQDIEDTIATAFAGKLTATKRSKFVEEQLKISRTCGYAHWISKIVITEEDGLQSIIEGEEILPSLEALSEQENLDKEILDGLYGYIEQVPVSTIAIPNFKCPACGKTNSGTEELDDLYPIDAVTVFFTLLQWSIQGRVERNDVL